MNDCRKVERLLSRYLDSETSSSDSALIKAHLDSCSLCKKELSKLTQIKELISVKERKAIPQDYLVYRLREEIKSLQHTAERVVWMSGLGSLSRRLIPVPAALIVLSLVFLILTQGQQLKEYSLDEHVLSGKQTTTALALNLILGVQN